MSSLIISGLNKTYISPNTAQRVVFDNFSLEIKHGSIVAIIGANGCGKTTLLNCIAGLVQYDKGVLRLMTKMIMIILALFSKLPRNLAALVEKY